MSEDLIEARSELLSSLQEKQAAVDLMLGGIALIIQGGPEGLRDVANMDGGSEIIIQTMQQMTDVIRLQQQESVGYAESWFDCQDALSDVRESLHRMVETITENEE